MSTKSEFLEWRDSRITQEYFDSVKGRIADLKEQLVGEVADSDFHQAARTTGAIRALYDILDLDYQESA